MANFLDVNEAFCLTTSIEEMANVLDATEGITDLDGVALINMARQLLGYLSRSLEGSTVDSLVITSTKLNGFYLFRLLKERYGTQPAVGVCLHNCETE